jgi:saccharopine dehydrogenase-like NADP-dependent oxidoreductase
VQLIDEVHEKKGEIVGFYSICGGLPAPQHNTNPFGYKLSWSPRGVLMASRNPAVYSVNGQKVEVAGVDLYAPHVYRTETVSPLGKYEWYPNRDSLKYIELFGIPEVQTIIRVCTVQLLRVCGSTISAKQLTLWMDGWMDGWID